MSFADIVGSQISKSCLNHSPSKAMYSFAKAERFPKKILRGCGTQAIYDLPSIQTKRSTTFGFGNKYDFTSDFKGKCLKFYDHKSDFDQQHPFAPRYSFGVGREKMLRAKINNYPGPGSYNASKSFGSDGIKVSMKGSGNRSLIIKRGKIPGPDEYKPLQMNPKGVYILSKYRNVSSVKFGNFEEERKKIRKEEGKDENEGDPTGPSPATYNKKPLMGTIFDSKYRSYAAITMAGRPKDPKLSGSVPGPGAYNIFSEFGMYGVKKES